MSLKNLRDLHQANPQIRKHMLYRSESLRGIDKDDLEQLRRLNVRYVVDLRSDEEVNVDSYQLPEDFCYYHISALHTQDGLENFYFFSLIHPHSTEEDIMKASSFVREGYKVLPFDNNAYQKIFDLMLQENGGILFHCSSGKDRTGVIAALILKMFGTSDVMVMNDYLLSNELILDELKDNIKNIGLNEELQAVLTYCCSVHEELLVSSFDEILQKYSSWDEYFACEYGLTQEKRKFLNKKYLR